MCVPSVQLRGIWLFGVHPAIVCGVRAPRRHAPRAAQEPLLDATLQELKTAFPKQQFLKALPF